MRSVTGGLDMTAPGRRNDALNRAAWTLGRWVAAGALDQADVEDELYAVAEVDGLVADDGDRQCWGEDPQRSQRGPAAAVLSLPNLPDGMAIVKQVRELDFGPRFNNMIRATDNAAWTQSMGGDGDCIVSYDGGSPQLKYPGVDQLNQAHQATYGEPMETATGSAYPVRFSIPSSNARTVSRSLCGPKTRRSRHWCTQLNHGVSDEQSRRAHALDTRPAKDGE